MSRRFSCSAALSLVLAGCGLAPQAPSQLRPMEAPEALATGWVATPRATIAIPKPAFLRLERGADKQPNLIVSSFGVFGGDAVRRVRDLGAVLKGAKPPIETLTDDVVWPNEAAPAPADLAGPDAWIVSGGFLVPTKTGAISLVAPGKPARALTKSKGGWFYHRTLWRDMDGDGRADLLTARATKPVFGSSRGELLWLRRPAKATDPWQETVIGEGPDVHFQLADLDGDGREEILASEFFAKRFSIWWSEGNAWRSRVLDTSCGAAFDLELADLNGDGRRDVVLTNHEADDKAGAFAYEVPADWRVAPWPRHTLTSGIKTIQKGPGAGSPGAPLVLAGMGPGGKPLVLLAGDGSQRVHLLVPQSGARADWTYTREDVADLGCTVGQLATGDIDSDGRPEIFAPAYDRDKIHVFTLERGGAGFKRAKR
jgi:hypothetical protein